jgi:hypothetical protein
MQTLSAGLLRPEGCLSSRSKPIKLSCFSPAPSLSAALKLGTRNSYVFKSNFKELWCLGFRRFSKKEVIYLVSEENGPKN